MSKKKKLQSPKADHIPDITKKVTELWAQYGRLQARREMLVGELDRVINQMRGIYTHIKALEKSE